MPVVPPWRCWLRRGLLTFGLLLLVALLWAVGVRATSAWRRVRVAELADVSAGSVWSGPGLRVVAYNIAHGRGVSGSNWDAGTSDEQAGRLAAIADLLAAERADVVILNEVDFDCTWSGGINQAREIARRAGYRYVLEQRNIDTGWPWLRFDFGNAVLSRWPITDAEPLGLPRYSLVESMLAGSKQAARCAIELAPGRSIAIVAVHFEHRHEPTRIASAEVLLALAGDSGDLIAAGDFNSTLPGFPYASTDGEGRTAIGVLTAPDADPRFAHALPEGAPTLEHFTIPSWDPDRVIDWVLYPPGWSAASRVIPAGWLSDHLPIAAELLPADE